MSAEFSIVGLVPVPLTFRDDAGRPHAMKTRAMLDLPDLVRAADLLRTAQVAQARLGMERVDPQSEQSLAALAQGASDAERTLEALLFLLIPTVPLATWAGVGFTLKWKLIEWWNAQQPAPPPGETAAVQGAGAPTPPSRPSPDSSAPTGSA
jgi:hypothetical protein